MQNFLLSVVIPVFNEDENIRQLYAELNKILDGFSCEIIFVNDGSTDASYDVIWQLSREDARVKLIHFTRNFGHEAATTAGLEYSRGDAVVIIDADLQDPPALILEMVEKWQQGFEVVYAVRKSRKGEHWLKKLSANFFYRFLAKLSDIKIPRNTGDFRLMDRLVVEDFKKLKEKNRFFRGLIAWAGYRQTGIEFERRKRNAGKTKYNYFKLIRLALDSITSFSITPLILITMIGFIIFLLSVGAAVFFVFIKLILKFPVSGWTSLMVTILIFSGFQIFLIGIVGEYIARMFIEVKDRPLYLVKEVIDRDKENDNAGEKGK